jgi:uncharacterized membrane protein YidH (DUF202 family)
MTPHPGSGATGDRDPERGPDDDGPARVVEVPGLAPERTTLAWQRTGIGVIVCSFLIFHTAFELGVIGVGVLAAGLGLTVAALSVFGFPAERYRQALPDDSWRLLVAVTGSVVCLGVLGAVTGAMTLFR